MVAGSVGPYGAFLHDGSEYTGAYAQEMSVEVSGSQLLKMEMMWSNRYKIIKKYDIVTVHFSTWLYVPFIVVD